MTRLKGICRRLARLGRDDDAVSAVEYAILLALIVLVSVAAIQGIGSRVINVYERIEVAIP